MIGTAITHVGLGNFSRAHLAYFTNELYRKIGPSEWGICGIDRDSERNQQLEGFLRKNEFKYSLVSRSPEAKKKIEISCLRQFINLGKDPKAAVEQLCLPTTRICTLTITEKGYYCDVNTGLLFDKHPEIVHDLENPLIPKSSIGLICSALKLRKERGLPPFTVLSCDNLPGNGHITQNAVSQYAELLDPRLREWIDNEVTFPSSMVDRITPQTSTPDAPIVCEDFAQWVIEDKFCNGRPMWELVDGVLVVDDVMPYEKMKVRMLNGSHSALSYLSYLAGHRDVDQAMATPDIYDFIGLYLDEVMPTVPEVPGVDLHWYKRKLQERFSNPYIKDQVQRLAEDGSSKLLTTMLPVIRQKAKRGKPMPMLTLAVASWIRYMAGKDDFGNDVKITDPLADKLCPIAQDCLASRDTKPFLEAAFGPKSLRYRGFAPMVQAWYERLLTEGPWRVLDSLDEFAYGFPAASVEGHGFDPEIDISPFNEHSLENIIKLSGDDLRHMFEDYDHDDDGFLLIDEVKQLMRDFVKKIRETLPDLPEADLREAFQIEDGADVDVELLLHETLEALPDPEDHSAAELLLMRLDADEDGMVNAEDFLSRFQEVLSVRYNAMRQIEQMEEQKAHEEDIKQETAMILPPAQSFKGSWAKMENWARDEVTTT
mmetsp:Transcript_22303/g.31185  ORF Transcript_22303/g.31185 Transcript_22303/m.31185 type:complete len:655 (-) Transcript_22303:889-2853(-)|eukprot:CAMPEP_0184482000 /NCGR_PEP_ID=MMETSP0113_2-20130426/3581_1 /TAXON_ID=91329 /ORGANISM="Norrisiella sphaerica, Strain BC52" /LENGTH=654 /DNA_ID=CAMNT_0026861501 /DNA_START=160 /DNA_END=2124 /DNA_ORIENTATION=+